MGTVGPRFLFAGFAALPSWPYLRAGEACLALALAGFSAHAETPVPAAVLAAIAAVVALGLLPDAPAGYARWLTAGLGVCLAAALMIGLVVAALARELGVVRLSLRSQGALEILEEGPDLGTIQGWTEALPWGPRTVVGLAVFTSDGCPLCRRVEPAVRHLMSDRCSR